jgi:hypothetical protein
MFMPRQVNLKELAEKNSNLDLTKLEELRKLRDRLSEHGAGRKRHKGVSPIKTGRRAQLVDDEENDPRLIRLQRNR